MPKFELKRRSYGPDKLEKKNQLLSKNLVATRKLCRDQKTWSRPKKNCGDQFVVLRQKTVQKHKKKAEN